MDAHAIVIRQPRQIEFDVLALNDPGPADLVVDVAYSGISTGTERLFWSGEMPDFPGMGYPLVPGYESAGKVVDAGPRPSPQNRKFCIRSWCQLFWSGARPFSVQPHRGWWYLLRESCP